MGKKRKELSQAEIWDDGALIDSWNEAYEEYKYYHSIHARGEKVQNVLEAYERGDDGTGSMTNIQATPTSKGPPVALSEDGEIDEDEAEHNDEAEQAVQQIGPQRPVQVVNQQDQVTASPLENVPDANHKASVAVSNLPEQLLAIGPQDPALKKLMMSWYWAGYYSGYYEGQQNARPAQEGSSAGTDAH